MANILTRVVWIATPLLVVVGAAIVCLNHQWSMAALMPEDTLTASGTARTDKTVSRGTDLGILDREAAELAAKYFAMGKHLIPRQYQVTVSQQVDGEWGAFVSLVDVQRTDGLVDCVHISGHRIFWIRGDGSCHSEEAVTNDSDERVDLPQLVNGPVAQLLARAYAIKNGMMPTETRIESHRAPNGEWVVGFFPGVWYGRASDNGPNENFPACTVIIVSQNATCRVLADNQVERIETGTLES